MNGKKAKALRRITYSRTEYRSGKRYYHAIARRAAQRAVMVKPRALARQGGVPTSTSTTEHPLRNAVRHCISSGWHVSTKIRNAIPRGFAHLARRRHTSLDRLFSAMPRVAIMQTLKNLGVH